MRLDLKSSIYRPIFRYPNPKLTQQHILLRGSDPAEVATSKCAGVQALLCLLSCDGCLPNSSISAHKLWSEFCKLPFPVKPLSAYALLDEMFQLIQAADPLFVPEEYGIDLRKKQVTRAVQLFLGFQSAKYIKYFKKHRLKFRAECLLFGRGCEDDMW